MNLKQTASKLAKGDVKGVIEDVAGKLERSVGLGGVVVISLASMVGSGLFVMPSFAADIMGPNRGSHGRPSPIPDLDQPEFGDQ